MQWSDKPFEDNLPGMRRVISVRRSSDLRHWSPQEDVLLPDSIDSPETEFYLLKGFRIGGGRTAFVSPTTGELQLFANDVRFAYWNNRGTLRVMVERIA